MSAVGYSNAEYEAAADMMGTGMDGVFGEYFDTELGDDFFSGLSDSDAIKFGIAGLPSPGSPMLKRSRHISPLHRYRSSPLTEARNLQKKISPGTPGTSRRVDALKQEEGIMPRSQRKQEPVLAKPFEDSMSVGIIEKLSKGPRVKSTCAAILKMGIGGGRKPFAQAQRTKGAVFSSDSDISPSNEPRGVEIPAKDMSPRKRELNDSWKNINSKQRQQANSGFPSMPQQVTQMQMVHGQSTQQGEQQSKEQQAQQLEWGSKVVAESSDAVIDKMVVDKMAVLQMHSGQGIAAPPAGFTGTGIAANSNRPRANVSLPWNATKETNKHFPAPKAVAPAQVPVMTPQHMQEFGAQLKQPKIEPQQQMGGRSLPPKAPQQQLQPSVSQTSMQQQLFHLQQLQRQQMAWEHQLEQQHKNKLLQQQVQRQAQHVAQQQAQVAHQQQLLNQQRIQVQQRQAAAAHQQQQQQQQQPASSTANDRRWSGSTGSGGGDEFGDILDILNSSMPGNGESFTVPNGHSFTDLDVLRTFDSPALPHRELDLNLKATPKPKSRAVRPTVKAEPTAATSQVNKPASSRKGTGRKKAVKGGDALLHGYFGQFDQTGSETLSKLELEQLLSECALKDDGPPANSKYALFSTFPEGFFDSMGNGNVDLASFVKYFQVCKRCTIAKTKMLGAAGQQAPGALGLAVIVRKMPHTFEGERIRSCNHYQWIWCPGVAGNQKCKGSNRHDSCPKYLAKSTFWKHTKKIEGRGGEGVATEDHADEPAPGFSPASEPASDHSPESPYWLP